MLRREDERTQTGESVGASETSLRASPPPTPTRSPTRSPPTPKVVVPNPIEDAAAAKKVRKVRFNPYVHKIRLPEEDYEEAQKARKSRIKEAPYHDELWDGDTYNFRDRELTTDELWTLRLKSKVSSIPRALKDPIKRGFRALQSFLPGSQPIDQVSAHAHKLVQKDDDSQTASPTMPMLSLQRQNSVARPIEDYAETVSSATFARYDELAQMIESLKTIPDDLNRAEKNLILFRKQLQEAKDELRRLRFEVPEMERRLARNANPRLLHYVQFARDDKVKRLQNEYEEVLRHKEKEQKRVETLAMSIYEENERVDRLGSKLSQLRGSQGESDAIFRFVVQEVGKDDAKMVKIWDTFDEMKLKVEKEKSMEKRLRRAAETIRKGVLQEHLHKARAALMDALELSKSIRSSQVQATMQMRPSPSLKPRASSMSAYFGSASLSPVDQQTALKQVESTPVTQRRKALTRARECCVQAVDVLERALDELEEHCTHMWTPSVLSWRKEVPNVTAPDTLKSNPLMRRSTSDFDNLTKLTNEEADREAQNRIQRKLAVVEQLTELSQRYAEFIDREATRTLGRLGALEEKKKALEREKADYERVVFEQARRQYIKGELDDTLSPLRTGVTGQNIVRKSTATSISSSASPDDDVDENSSMVFALHDDSPKMAGASSPGSSSATSREAF